MKQPISFQNRIEAGRILAEKLDTFKVEKPIVLALPRGGVPVATEIAKRLNTLLDIVGVKKIGAPENPEFAIGAVVEDGTYILNELALSSYHLSKLEISSKIEDKKNEALKLALKFRQGNPLPDLKDKTVIVADDGLATGMTALAVAKFLKINQAKKIIFASPVCATETANHLSSVYDLVICCSKPDLFRSVGNWYIDFSQLTDAEVIKMISQFKQKKFNIQDASEISIPCGEVVLNGIYTLPKSAKAIIMFVHGSGSGRLSPRNQKVATELNQVGFGTLLFDLLTEKESLDRKKVFDISLLARRLVETSRWLKEKTQGQYPIGYFGASTGAGAALEAAMQFKEVYAIVLRGGRPDLAPHAAEVLAPTLFIVGAEDHLVLELNRRVLDVFKNGKLEVIPGATHLFEEPGTLEQVVELSKSWFIENLHE